jgi:Predicted membrane protein (DUF2339)
MTTNEKLDAILQKIDALSKSQSQLQFDLEQLRTETRHLKFDQLEEVEIKENAPEEVPWEQQSLSYTEVEETHKIAEIHEVSTLKAAINATTTEKKTESILEKAIPEWDLEKFVGENLANKLGAFVTVLGLGIGVKYAIDHDLISPLARILLGYLAGFALIFVANRLRPKYEDLSAAILGAGLASVYLVTYFAYDLYQLMPQIVAFFSMVAITVATVWAALQYDKQVIAVGALIGAYLVPFLLSTGEDKPITLFSYIAIINVGILYIAFKKYWQVLYYGSFLATWFIFMIWATTNQDQMWVGLAFSTLFFVIFYISFLAFKIRKNEPFEPFQGMLLVINALFYLRSGFYFLEGIDNAEQFESLFVFENGLIHLGVSLYIFQKNIKDKSIFYLLSGLGLLMITLAAGIEFEGISLTGIWGGLMVLQFWIGRTQKIPAYEHFARPLFVFSLLSLIYSWFGGFYDRNAFLTPIFNKYFATTFLMIAAFEFIRRTHNDTRFELPSRNEGNRGWVGAGFGLIVIFLTYFLFFNEIHNYFNNAIKANIYSENVPNLNLFNAAWKINYTLIFAIVLNYLNLSRWKNTNHAAFTAMFSFLALVAALTWGFENMDSLRYNFLHWEDATTPKTNFAWLLRYPFVALIGGLLWYLQKTVKTFFSDDESATLAFDIGANIITLTVLSKELIHWLELAGYDKAQLWALSILFGLYSFVLIYFGIKHRKKHLRVAAIVLFGLTLVKVFVHDLAGLETIQKTVVMISLGVLLLIISYIYNRFGKEEG